MALAEQLSAGKTTACEKVRAFYDYVGDELVYSFNGRDWGAQAALGEMGADCTEYSDLLIALSRAMGIPARYREGVLYIEYASAAAAQRTRLDRGLPAWFRLDAAGPHPGSHIADACDDYFASLPADHILVTNGRNPSTLRGASYFSHLYWPGNSTDIRIEDFGWEITAVE